LIRTSFALLLAAASFSATAAMAQDSAADLKYCAELSRLFTTYVGTSEFSPSSPFDRRTDTEARYALSRCSHGDAKTAIPILELRLRNAKVDLPPRG
jgi:hypothetical protein